MQIATKVPRPRGSVWTDPKVRAWMFQLLAIVLVVAMGWFLYDNTMTNLEKRGITTGFAFLNNTAGFGIAQHLIDYTESDSYGRVFLVGLLNTLLVSVIGIVMATLMGFLLGVARLSPNWLMRQLATVYIEIFRNIPPLLQILFWYFAVMLSLPGPRQSLSVLDSFFLNSRGLYMPSPNLSETFGLFMGALVISIVAIVVLARWAKARREASGKIFPVSLGALGILLVIPRGPGGWLAGGVGRTGVDGVQLPQWLGADSRAYSADVGADHVHRGIYRRDCPVGYSVGKSWPNRGCLFAGSACRPHAASGDYSASATGHYSATDQPVPESSKEFLTRCGDWLPRDGLAVCRYGAESNRAGN